MSRSSSRFCTRFGLCRSRGLFKAHFPMSEELFAIHKLAATGFFQAFADLGSYGFAGMAKDLRGDAALFIGRQPVEQPFLQQPRFLVTLKKAKSVADHFTGRGIAPGLD